MATPASAPSRALDLAGLLFHCGGEPFAVPLEEPAALPIQIGTICGLPAWGAAATPRETLRVARQFVRAGRLGLLIAHDVMSGRWVLGVTIPPVRLTGCVAGDINALPIRRLARTARQKRATPLEQAIALADALDVDAAGRKTFALLHGLLERAVSLLPARVPHDDRHAWALTQITRLLFLRFVESEGWLAGNPRFLAEVFDQCLVARRDPTRHLLHPLFFGTLNRQRDERSRLARDFGAIPFLNGGLFEPHAIERRYALRLPVEYWRDAFAALVDRVEVTLDDTAEDGRVTPELLGRVFEGVMHPAERQHEGTFFTPPALVTAMLRETIACHLAPKLRRSEDAIERALDDPDDELRRLLLDVTVLDPAVGSGAFLVGALALLHGPGQRHPARVRHLVTRRLFGVDRHPGAVRLCEMRLWLEVLRSLRGRAPQHIPPLPNLDAQVRAGDALIDPLGAIVLNDIAARRIRAQHRMILRSHGSAKRSAIAESRRTERSAMLRALRQEEAAIDLEIAELLATARAPSLFGDRPRLDIALRREVQIRRRHRAALRNECRRLVRDSLATPFALSAAFSPVMATRGGFDLVVGNPPWVRAERLPPETRDALASRYRWWRSGSSTGWRHLPDLSVAFVERGFGLLAAGGTMAFLVPAKLATAGYGAACRAALLHRSTLHRVADLGNDPRAGFDATTYPLAIIASRRVPADGHAVRLGLHSDDAAQRQVAWQSSSEWPTSSPDAQRIALRLRAIHPPLGEFVKPQLGIKTGANAAFLNPGESLAPWSRPALRGRDIRAFSATARTMILWPADRRGVAWTTLPATVAEHLASHRTTLERRADQHGGPWWQLFRTRAATAPHRVVWRDLATELQATCFFETGAVPLNSCYVASVANESIAAALTAWLNSTIVRALARLHAEPAAGGCARFAARTISQVPLPSCALDHEELAALARAARTADVQEALDRCVARLLGLSESEIDTLGELASHRR